MAIISPSSEFTGKGGGAWDDGLIWKVSEGLVGGLGLGSGSSLEYWAAASTSVITTSSSSTVAHMARKGRKGKGKNAKGKGSKDNAVGGGGTTPKTPQTPQTPPLVLTDVAVELVAVDPVIDPAVVDPVTDPAVVDPLVDMAATIITVPFATTESGEVAVGGDGAGDEEEEAAVEGGDVIQEEVTQEVTEEEVTQEVTEEVTQQVTQEGEEVTQEVTEEVTQPGEEETPEPIVVVSFLEGQSRLFGAVKNFGLLIAGHLLWLLARANGAVKSRLGGAWREVRILTRLAFLAPWVFFRELRRNLLYPYHVDVPDFEAGGVRGVRSFHVSGRTSGIGIAPVGGWGEVPVPVPVHVHGGRGGIGGGRGGGHPGLRRAGGSGSGGAKKNRSTPLHERAWGAIKNKVGDLIFTVKAVSAWVAALVKWLFGWAVAVTSFVLDWTVGLFLPQKEDLKGKTAGALMAKMVGMPESEDDSSGRELEPSSDAGSSDTGTGGGSKENGNVNGNGNGSDGKEKKPPKKADNVGGQRRKGGGKKKGGGRRK